MERPPPRRSGARKAPREGMKTSRHPAAIPGAVKGKVTRHSRRGGVAPAGPAPDPEPVGHRPSREEAEKRRHHGEDDAAGEDPEIQGLDGAEVVRRRPLADEAAVGRALPERGDEHHGLREHEQAPEDGQAREEQEDGLPPAFPRYRSSRRRTAAGGNEHGTG